MDNPRKDWVYIKLNELKKAIEQDTYNLSRDSQTAIDVKFQQLKQLIDDEYGKVNSAMNVSIQQ